MSGQLEIADTTVKQVTSKTAPVSIVVMDSKIQHEFLISTLPPNRDAILGLDWFSKTKAIVDPANEKLIFP